MTISGFFINDEDYFENQCKKVEAQIFLSFLLVPFIDGWPFFCLVTLVTLVDLILKQAIGIVYDVGRKKKMGQLFVFY